MPSKNGVGIRVWRFLKRCATTSFPGDLTPAEYAVRFQHVISDGTDLEHDAFPGPQDELAQLASRRVEKSAARQATPTVKITDHSYCI